MSCCGQKRSALKQSPPASTRDIARAINSAKRPPASAPGQRDQLHPSAAMLAYLARNASLLKIRVLTSEGERAKAVRARDRTGEGVRGRKAQVR
jgi:hypothetical protein